MNPSNSWPAQSHIRSELASAYALNGETERATAELAEARRLSSDDSPFEPRPIAGSWNLRGSCAEDPGSVRSYLFAGLREAAMSRLPQVEEGDNNVPQRVEVVMGP